MGSKRITVFALFNYNISLQFMLNRDAFVVLSLDGTSGGKTDV